MTQRTDAQMLDDLANQIDQSVRVEEIDPPNVDRELLSSCLARINSLKRSKMPTKLNNGSPCLRAEVDAAIRSDLPSDSNWSEEMRTSVFDQHIATLDISDDTAPTAESLKEAAVFLRAIIIGIETYKKKIARSLSH